MMPVKSEFFNQLNIGSRYPIFQAPMSGVSSSAAMPLAAVAAGCVGGIGAAKLTPSELRDILKSIRAQQKQQQQPSDGVSRLAGIHVNVQLFSDFDPPLPSLSAAPSSVDWSDPAHAQWAKDAYVFEQSTLQESNNSSESGAAIKKNRSIKEQTTKAATSASSSSSTAMEKEQQLAEFQKKLTAFESSYKQKVAGLFEVALEQAPTVFSTIFGVPTREMLAAAHKRGILVGATATTAEEAREQIAAGVDVLFLQSTHAGGHQGSIRAPRSALLSGAQGSSLAFDHSGILNAQRRIAGNEEDDDEEQPLIALAKLLHDVSGISISNGAEPPTMMMQQRHEARRRAPLPNSNQDALMEQRPLLVAAGGITTGDDVKNVLSMRSKSKQEQRQQEHQATVPELFSSFDAVSIGTRLLMTQESQWSPAHRHGFATFQQQESTSRPSVFTRAFTGRFCRALLNEAIVGLNAQKHPERVLPFPFHALVTQKRLADAAATKLVTNQVDDDDDDDDDDDVAAVVAEEAIDGGGGSSVLPLDDAVAASAVDELNNLTLTAAAERLNILCGSQAHVVARLTAEHKTSTTKAAEESTESVLRQIAHEAGL